MIKLSNFVTYFHNETADEKLFKLNCGTHFYGEFRVSHHEINCVTKLSTFILLY
jgi:hypothetical protein